MCIGRCGFYWPLGAVIASLKAGDEVIIKPGIGFTKAPRKNEDTKEIIAKVDDLSALTASGILLACKDGMGVKATGKHFDDFKLSLLAKEILEKGVRAVYPEYFNKEQET